MKNAAVFNHIFRNLEIAPHASVLDVGCNTSATLQFMKDKYQLTGNLIGIDKRSLNFEPVEKQKEQGITLLEMNASEPLLFEDESFDIIFHKDTLECITDIDSHINELHRILKKGGLIICAHRDWESIVVNGSNKDLINKAIYGYANFLQSSWMDTCDSWIGRRIYGYFNKTGLFNGSIECFNEIQTEFLPGMRGYSYIHDFKDFIKPKGFLTEKEYSELLTDIQATYERKEYIFSYPLYIYKGQKI